MYHNTKQQKRITKMVKKALNLPQNISKEDGKIFMGEGGWDEREKIQSHNYTTMEQYGGNENLTIIYDNGFQLIWCPTHSSPS